LAAQNVNRRQSIPEFHKGSDAVQQLQLPDDNHIDVIADSFSFTVAKMSVFMLPRPLTHYPIGSLPHQWAAGGFDDNMFIMHCGHAHMTWKTVTTTGAEVTMFHDAGMHSEQHSSALARV
jgi:hypothetical protein